MSIVILLAIGLILIFINIRVIKRDNKDLFEEKLDRISPNSEDYNFEIGELRKEFGETIFELQKEIESLKEEIESIKKLNLKTKEKNFTDDNINKSNHEIHKKIDVVVDNNITDEDNDMGEEENLKAKEIKKLMKDGLSTDEISQRLNIGKGEVLLIQKLYIK
ncbi:DUF6115 domain-containing protein [Clostridium guangxiense]|uniref:DUF6115 domain-containing protein n=1 Tax=Clostridium guangxiense TaxID=1662055 RepID=UPI001E28C87F|nr:hypothetical protein [Clostridium guangxiense]MCD2345214.1 hypothetical protein [Clostridium guangxiense]